MNDVEAVDVLFCTVDVRFVAVIFLDRNTTCPAERRCDSFLFGRNVFSPHVLMPEVEWPQRLIVKHSHIGRYVTNEYAWDKAWNSELGCVFRQSTISLSLEANSHSGGENAKNGRL